MPGLPRWLARNLVPGSFAAGRDADLRPPRAFRFGCLRTTGSYLEESRVVAERQLEGLHRLRNGLLYRKRSAGQAFGHVLLHDPRGIIARGAARYDCESSWGPTRFTEERES